MDLRDYLLSGPSFYVSPGCLQSHQLALEVLSLSINSAGSRTSGLLAKSLLFLVMNNVQFAFLLIDLYQQVFSVVFLLKVFSSCRRPIVKINTFQQADPFIVCRFICIL
jgi:hypothetical protein